MSELKDIKSYNLKELKEELTKMGEKPFLFLLQMLRQTTDMFAPR